MSTTETIALPPLHAQPEPEPEPRSTRFPRPRALTTPVVAAALAAFTLVSLYLRLKGFSMHYWVDEGISVGIARHPISQIPHLLREDGSPPLYYVLLHFWMQAFGTTEPATHALSLIFATLTIPAAYWAGASIYDRRAGLFCAALAAGAPYLNSYARETRMYSLMALVSVLVAAGFAQSFVHRRRRYLPLFSLSLTAALYTHNWGLFLGLASAVAFGLCLYSTPAERRRKLLRDGAIGFGAVALLYLPWLPTVMYQAAHTGAPWDLPPVLWSLTQGSYFLVGGRGAAVALLLAGGAGLFALRSDTSLNRSRLELIAKAMLVLGLGTMLIAWVYSKTNSAWAPRYLAVVIGPAILLFGLGLSRARRLGVAAMVLVALFWILDPVPTALYSKSDVAEAVAHVRPHVRPGTLVLSTQPEQVPTIDYYMPAGVRYATPLGPVVDPGVMDWQGALAKFRRSSVRRTLVPLLNSVAPGQRVVLVTPLNLSHAPLYMELINRASTQWARYLEHDRSFVRISFASPNVNSGLGVRAMVFLRRR